jgi:hypothetical protein
MVMVVEVWVLISEKTSYDFRYSIEGLFTKYHKSVGQRESNARSQRKKAFALKFDV